MPAARTGQARSSDYDVAGRQAQQRQAWLVARVRLMPNLLSQSPPWVRGVFDHAWAPMRAMNQQIRGLPPSLWDYLLSCEGGFVSVCAGDSRYVPGPATIGNRTVHNVAFVAVTDLAEDNEQPLHVLGHLIDHYLGCAGEIDGPWLSEGGGVSAQWQQAGQRLTDLFALGYGVDEIALSGPREYLAQSLALYCRERQRLNVADPQIDKWLRSTLWDVAFWRAAGGGDTKGS